MMVGVVDSRLGLEEEGRRLLAWSTAKTDREAAARVGIKQSAWTRWRNRRRLPPCSDRFSEFVAAWRRSGSDAAAARILHVDEEAFHSWRRNNQLPPCLGNRKVRHSKRRFRLDAFSPTAA